jgi:hypothetical protein
VSWINGPFSYVMGGNPDDGVITFDEWQVRQSVAAGIPQVVVQRAEDGPGYVVVGALDEKPVGGETYGEFAEAKAVRDRLNTQPRRDAAQASTGKPEASRAALRYQAALVGPEQWEIHTLKPQYVGKSVDGVTYADHAAAKAAADQLEAIGVAA